MCRILASLCKYLDTTSLSKSELEAGEQKTFNQTSNSKIDRLSSTPASTSSLREEVPTPQAQVEFTEEKKIEGEVSLSKHQSISLPYTSTTQLDTKPTQIIDETVSATSPTDNNHGFLPPQKEDELHTVDATIEEKNQNESHVNKQSAIEGNTGETDKKMLDEPESCETDAHLEIEPVNPTVKTTVNLSEDNQQSKEQVSSVLKVLKEHIEDTIISKRKEGSKQKKRPAMYQPSIRTADSTKHPRNNSNKQAGESGSLTRSLRMHLHAMIGRRNQFRLSLLPERTDDLEEEMEVVGSNGQTNTWFASQDEWYTDVVHPDLGKLLIEGANWESYSGAAQLRWVLSGREIYVLAASSKGTISGYIPLTRLYLFEDHLVLCTKALEESVRQALDNAGCPDCTYLDDNNGVPKGWVLFQHVHPTVAVSHDDSAGILNILRPIHDIEIVLRGGIRLTHSSWLNGYPPTISIRGSENNDLEVVIDGNIACNDDSGRYTTDSWDTSGEHSIFCGGVTQSYQLVDVTDEWEFFDAFSYSLNGIKKNVVTICGIAISASAESEFMALVPSNNTCLLGAVPGQIALSSNVDALSTSEYLAVADFPIVWAIPPNPLTCKKPSSFVKMISCVNVVEPTEKRNRKINQNILRWCHAILNASRRRLSVSPSTEETKYLWATYRRAAKRYWGDLR